MYKNILIPTDGSELSEKVVGDGVRLAKILNAKIVGIHVLEPAYALPTEFGVMNADLLQQYEASARRQGDVYLDRKMMASLVFWKAACARRSSSMGFIGSP
ncbi:MAG: universal stress protein [Gammaproteobacteria bacterium]|nr:universal stress protein [Gammaproteobacteria bacterium]